MINCLGVFIWLMKDEYFILLNYFLYWNVLGEVIKFGWFYFINGYLWFCVNFFLSYFYEMLMNYLMMEGMVLEVLIYIGFFVLIFCFLIVLVIYLLFKEFCILFGVNLMNFFIVYLFKDLFFIVFRCGLLKFVCIIVVIIMYYFLLVFFIWMLIIVFEMWRVFFKICI